MTQRIISLLIGYLFGMILFSPIAARINKIDIYNEGSGNPGMANTGRVLGKKWAAFVLLGDVLKTVVACAISWALFHETCGNIVILYAGFGSALGHCFPVWHHFQGGKAVACLAATGILYSPLFGTLSLLLGGVAVLCKLGLKWAAAIISVSYAVFIGFTAPPEAFFMSVLMAILMIDRNARKNRLDKK